MTTVQRSHIRNNATSCLRIVNAHQYNYEVVLFT